MHLMDKQQRWPLHPTPTDRRIHTLQLEWRLETLDDDGSVVDDDPMAWQKAGKLNVCRDSWMRWQESVTNCRIIKSFFDSSHVAALEAPLLPCPTIYHIVWMHFTMSYDCYPPRTRLLTDEWRTMWADMVGKAPTSHQPILVTLSVVSGCIPF